MSFSATLPVKPSVTTTSAAPVDEHRALDVADEVEARPGALASALVRVDDDRRAARGLLAVGEQADARALDAEHAARERRAHEGELDEVLGPHLGVGADVEQRHRLAGHRQRQGERRAVDAAGALDVEQRRRPAPRRWSPPETSASASPLGDRAGGAHDRGLGLRRARPWRAPAPWRSRPGRRRPRRPRRGRRARSAGPKSSTRVAVAAAASAAPGATSAGPRSAPLASTATVTAQPWALARARDRGRARGRARRPRARVVCRTPGRRGGEARAVALRARVVGRRGDLVLRAALRRAGVRLLLLRDGHGAAKATEAQKAEGRRRKAENSGPCFLPLCLLPSNPASARSVSPTADRARARANDRRAPCSDPPRTPGTGRRSPRGR